MSIVAPQARYLADFDRQNGSLKMSAANEPQSQRLSPDKAPLRTKSVMALMNSTLFGLFNAHDFSEPSTPEYRSRKELLQDNEEGPDPPAFAKRHPIKLLIRLAVLYIFGVGYGILVTHLHDNNALVVVKFDLHRDKPRYLAAWGLIGVLLGALLPLVDYVFPDNSKRNATGWNDIVRCVGAFLGIAWGVKKLAWGSAMEASFTLALVNPAMWYLIDRTRDGFFLSSAAAVSGTLLLMQSAPSILPNYRTAEETFAVAVWISSVLFSSCVCFGNIGRMLVPRNRWD